MAGISIPIVTEFDGGGISKAVAQFKNLETASDKVGFVAKKAAQTAAIGFAALAASAAAAGAVLFKAAEAAAEDQKAQQQLASQIKATTDATDVQIKGVEDFIDKTQRASGIADDKLRPALGRLSAATGDVNKAQDLLNVALDLSAATGKDVTTIAGALARAQEGAYGPLEKLGIGYEKGEVKARGFEAVQKDLEERFSGAALAKAGTYEGVMARLGITFDELKETVGYKILPLMTDLGDAALRIGDAFGKKGAAGGIAQLRAEIVSLGTDGAGMKNTFASIYDAIVGFVNGVQAALAIPMAAIHFLRTGDLGTYTVKKLPSFADLMAQNPQTSYAVTSRQAEAQFNLGVNTITPSSGASGGAPGITKRGATPPTIFDKTEGNAGGFENAGIGGIQGFPNLTINLDASSSLISSPATIGQDIIDAILAAQRNSGQVFAPAVTF
jgi:hypothetical protein